MMRRPRRLRLAIVLAVLLFLAVAIKKIYDYAAPPSHEKESNFIFPADSERVRPSPVLSRPPLPPFRFRQVGGFTNDASHLNKTPIYGIAAVSSEDDIRNALAFARSRQLKVTCAGEQHSMGGQSFSRDGIVLDLRSFNRMTIDRQRKTVVVQSGVRWWQLQQALDAQGLAVKSMQSINLFSIGGTLSVNAHGIDPQPGPVAPTVRWLRVMLSSGETVKASPAENADLFRHVLGGYGLFGVILEAELDVVANEVYARRTFYVDYHQLPGFYRDHVENVHEIGLAFARLSVAPGTFLRETAVHIYPRAEFRGTLPPLQPARHNSLDRFVINFSKTSGFGRWLRWSLEKSVEPQLHACLTRNQAMGRQEDCLVPRNGEMYDDMAYLKNRLPDTDILQEYFVPFDRMPEFVDSLRAIVLRNRANLLNVTIRTVHRDSITALPYAKQDMFGLVLYFNVRFNNRDNEVLQKTTSDLIDAAAASGGTFYLPYQLFYSKEQLRRAYPEIDEFFAAKRRYDSAGLFTNKFYERYKS